MNTVSLFPLNCQASFLAHRSIQQNLNISVRTRNFASISYAIWSLAYQFEILCAIPHGKKNKSFRAISSKAILVASPNNNCQILTKRHVSVMKESKFNKDIS